MKQTLWCCVGFGFDEPYYNLSSLSEKRKDSIWKFTIEFTRDTNLQWKNFQEIGWKCIKVEVIIKPI